MKTWKNALSEGDLQQAITLIIEDIKASPKDAGLRSSFIELLCIDGDFERADDQLIQSINCSLNIYLVRVSYAIW